MWRWFVYPGLILAILICAAPMGAVAWSSWFAEAHGCRLDESGYHPCIVDGTDWGGTLGAMFISGWLMLVTIPLGGILTVVLIVVFLIDKIRRPKRAAQ